VESVNGVSLSPDKADQKSISSLDPRPPTPSSPSLPNNHSIDLPPNSAEEHNPTFQSKRLCERWLDNLFMVLYEVHFLRLILTTGSTSVHTLASRMGAFHETATTLP